ncbi:chemotaxis protein CheB [Gimesia aquarii]|uniref:histidine kinase n=1 Tax=Gimesia aquarii TaxID=2527964 RepID=A0A517X043_9PLAN|nr:chemotaxis protein CheB [Gimesia aquarii]QDU10867.1 Autoinducer 2 sensor kinase/phosphatase LuxQ [Gimesia aquarii]
MSDEKDFLIVAIGASAGGLEALEELFYNMPLDSGLAYVIIQHLSPDFKSVMDQLLERKTKIPICVIKDGMEIKPNTIYLLPPKKEVIVSNSKLLLTDRSVSRQLSFPIDEFFRSLAQDVGHRAVGIVLSGTGTDGSRGILDIHSAGGLVIAQTESSAAFDGMPRSACDSGIVDIVLSPKAIPPALIRYKNNPTEVSKRGNHPEELSDALDYMDTEMRSILNQLNRTYGLDFSQYKAPTIARRVERRLALSGTLQLEEYAARIENDAEELEQLYRDMLIGVTGFFRDHTVFERLELDIIPELVKNVTEDGEFRAWVAGTATGEEAYSLAILLVEAFEAAGKYCRAKIFASDVHDQSLLFAGRGVYHSEHLAGVTPERLKRFFISRQNGYHVIPELRKMVVFTPHNFLRDAPFTRLDLVTCRNVLIYLTQPAQRKALSMFHFGLKTGGVLCLGASESVGDLDDEFESIYDVARIYRKHRDTQLTTNSRIIPPPKLLKRTGISADWTTKSTHSSDALKNAVSVSSLLSVYDQLLDEFMPPSILINEDRELLHSFAGAGRFLRVGDGRPTTDVLDIIHSDLKNVFLAAIRRVCKNFQPLTYRGIRCQIDDEHEFVQLTVIPYSDEKKVNRLLVRFETDIEPEENTIEEIVASGFSIEELHALDRELQSTRNNLQSTIQELQITNEESQAANEELTAANEELQSTNEELHSVNEELYTVNAEHQRKIDELTELTDDMDNLLTTTNVHTLFLDGELRLRRFTPRIAEIFNLIPQDISRRFGSFTYNLIDDDLIDEIKSVLESEEPFQREVCDRNGDWFLLRIFPYLASGKVDGVVLTLIDITSLKNAAEALRLSEERFDLAVRGSNEGIWDWPDVTQEAMWCSDRMYDLMEIDRNKMEFSYSLWRDLLHHEDKERVLKQLNMHLDSSERYDVEYRLECGNGEYRWFHTCGEAVRDSNGKAIRMAGSLEDITESRKDREEVREAVRRRDQFLAMLSHELRNPLGAILNSTTLLEGEILDSQLAKEACGVIARQSRQMARLLEDLLDVSRITHGKIELHCKILDLVELTTEAINIVQPQFESSDQHISVETPDDPVYVYGDPTRLQQVFVNLLTNATKYTPVKGDISIIVTFNDNQAIVRIRDTGCGMSPEMLEKAFELFVQSDATIDRSNGGMGVGLTLVRAVLKLHGGNISAQSEGPNSGSEFIVRLPCSEKPRQVSMPIMKQGINVHKVVIVEDMEDARFTLEAILQSKGFEVISAKNGTEGLKLIQSEHPDLALVDIGLPEMDGYEIAHHLRKDQKNDDIYLVALTGYGQSKDRKAVKDAGFNEHLVKPLKAEELDQVLMTHTQQPEGYESFTERK